MATRERVLRVEPGWACWRVGVELDASDAELDLRRGRRAKAGPVVVAIQMQGGHRRRTLVVRIRFDLEAIRIIRGWQRVA
eukprot:5695752-Prymnesium_polylepis.1